MLEVKNLTKVYSGKGGVQVRALDGVTVQFPEKGMVFLLGKSGSGKSTLLNVAGGLDKPDGGEIIVKGRSSKDFSAADFDSYRNTFIGFVFQEYNILNEFTIEQNIALALQLQSKPNDKKAVADLLEQVDLKDYGKRKPNTLSGGQKQRVAIARALIKQPEIIMADEPTGALDSNTGKQVLDTLKKLSETKLVIVVSHDREFAEFYGDRIIELKDGKIISDVSKTFIQPDNSEENVVVISDDTIRVKNGAEITDDDVKKIASILKKRGGEAIIASGEKEVEDVKRVCRINDDGSKESFADTENVEIKQYNGKETKFIKSRLPMGHAIKMGASGLRSKPIRLIFTILLSVAAFVMFGVTSTFMLYDPNYSISKALQEANYPAIVLTKSYKVSNQNVQINNSTGEEKVESSYESEYKTLFGASELAEKSKGNLKFAGVFTFMDTTYGNRADYSMDLVSGKTYLPVSVKADKKEYYLETNPLGFSDCGAAYLHSVDYNINGTYPSAKDEIALPEYLAWLFVETENSGLNAPSDLIGKKIRFTGRGIFRSEDVFTVTAILSVGEIPAKYDVLKSVNSISDKTKDQLQTSLADYLRSSFHTIVFVDESFYEEYKTRISRDGGRYIDGVNFKQLRFDTNSGEYELNEWDSVTALTERLYQSNKNDLAFYALDGSVIETPAFESGKLYLSAEMYRSIMRNKLSSYLDVIASNAAYDANANAIFNDESFGDKRSELWEAKDLSEYIGYCNTWFQDLSYKRYLFDAASRLRGDLGSDEFTNAFEKIEAYRNGQENAAAPTQSDWTTIENGVLAEYAARYPQECYARILEFFMNFGEYPFGDDSWQIRDSLYNQNYSEQDFQVYKAQIDEFLSSKGKSMTNVKAIFAFSANDLVKTMYYCDKTNARGALEIVGYFDSATANIGPSYALSETWLNAHGSKNQDSQYSWHTVPKTDYVRPADAKYNYILSPTDNSQAQISASLSASGPVVLWINNMVYEELQTFLSLIKMLEKVFLIVGLVVGGIAALFLLNFISVSISSKKKDIGILRAVGARGSDVFKIFYAEAFIIAIICFILAAVGSFFVCFFLNQSLVKAVSMQLLNFNVVNIGLILGVSVFVSIIATFFPVFFAARKSPVESIRAL